MSFVTYNAKRISIDKVKLGLRFEMNNRFPVQVINDILDVYIGSNRGENVKTMRYQGSNTKPRRCKIPLDGVTYPSLVVETGLVAIRGNRPNLLPYATFEFNHSKVFSSDEAYESFIRVMQDLLPGGGFASLLEDGFVYYIEIAIDFIRNNMSDIEAFHSKAMAGRRFGPHFAPPETMYLFTTGSKQRALALYDKRLQASKMTNRRYRRPRLRVEARIRLNTNKRLKGTKVGELASALPNLFDGLQLLDRSRLAATFAAGRHASFMRRVVRDGLQKALEGRDNPDRKRRIGMLLRATVPWWEPNRLWEECREVLRSFGTRCPLN